MLLILTNKLDAHADHLIAQVAGRFPVLRINTDDFLGEYDFALGVTGEGRLDGWITDRHGHRFDFAQRAVGWYRKPDFDRMLVSADPEFAGLVRSEAAAFTDALCALPQIDWVNPSAADFAGRSKPAQLLLARELGFSVPDTLITNRAEAALGFVGGLPGGAIVKSVYSASVRFDGFDFACITKRIDLPTLEENRDSIAVCPTQLQREIPKQCDIRVTVVGEEVFACRIDSQLHAATQVDWRVDPDVCRYTPLELPGWARDACREFVRRSGLQYGAIDLVLSPDGEYFFLENNPAGQYLWIELDTGMPITAALIDLFARAMEAPAH